jgi:hypothetical protein
MDVSRVRSFIEEILTSFQRAFAVKIVPEYKCIGTADYTSSFELACDAARGISRA